MRTAEIGSLMFGDINDAGDESYSVRRELVRMALPRRVYTNSHYDYIAEVARNVVERKSELTGLRITRQPEFLRHFTCDLEPIAAKSVSIKA